MAQTIDIDGVSWSLFSTAAAALGVSITVDQDTTLLWQTGGTVEDTAGVVLDHAESGGPWTVTLTVDTGLSVCDEMATDDPPVAAVVLTHPRIAPASGIAIQITTTSNIVIERLGIYALRTSADAISISGGAWTSVVVRYNVIYGGNHGVLTASGASGNVAKIHNNFIWGVNRGIRDTHSGNTAYFAFNVVKQDPESTRASVVWNDAGSMSIHGNEVYLGGGTDCYVTDSSWTANSYNVSSDATSPDAAYRNMSWMECVRNANQGEHDFRPVESREWAANLISGISHESNNVAGWSLVSNYASAASEALRGSYVIRRAISGETTDGYARLAMESGELESWCSFYFDSSMVMDSGYDYEILRVSYTTGRTELCYGRDATGYYFYLTGSYADGTKWRGFSHGDAVWILFHTLIDASGVVEIYAQPKGTGGHGAAVASSSTNTSGATAITYFYIGNWSEDASTVGNNDFDHVQYCSADHGEPDDSTTPYGDSTAAIGCGDFSSAGIGTTDIAGNPRLTDWLQGAWQGAGGGSVALSGNAYAVADASAAMARARAIAGAASATASASGSLGIIRVTTWVEDFAVSDRTITGWTGNMGTWATLLGDSWEIVSGGALNPNSTQLNANYVALTPTGDIEVRGVVGSEKRKERLYARLSDPGASFNCYSVSLKASGSNLQIYRIVAGASTQIGSDGTAPSSGQEIGIRIEGAGATIALSALLDGAVDFAVDDTDAARITADGYVGFGGGYINNVLDDFTVEEIAGSVALSGNAYAVADASAAMARARAIAGAASATASASGSLGIIRGLAGASSAVATASGALTVTAGGAVPLVGAAYATSTADGSLSIARSVSGQASATSTCSGSLSIIRGIAGQSSATSTASGDLTVTAAGITPVAGAAYATSTAAGALSVARGIAGASYATADAAGRLARVRPLAGAAYATSSARGSMGTGVYAAIGTSILCRASLADPLVRVSISDPLVRVATLEA